MISHQGIFSPNEDAVELSTCDLQWDPVALRLSAEAGVRYLVVRFHQGDLRLKDTTIPRKRCLQIARVRRFGVSVWLIVAQGDLNAFLHRLEDYAVLGRDVSTATSQSPLLLTSSAAGLAGMGGGPGELGARGGRRYAARGDITICLNGFVQ